MLQRQSSARLLLRPALRAFSCCASADDASGVVTAEPGSVSEYHQHILVQLPRPVASGPAAQAPGGSWWPKLIEKEPEVVAAFVGLAKYQDHIGGKVKVTAFDDVLPSGQQQPGRRQVNLLAYPAGLRFDGLTMDQVGLAVALAAADDPDELLAGAEQLKAVAAVKERMAAAPDLAIFVCCHGTRDARCGSLGAPLAAALQRLVAERGLEQQVQVFQTSHVGGHKFAGNVVTYGAMHPCDGDWYGGVNASNAAAFLDALIGIELGSDGGAEDPKLRPLWRGRMGLSKEEQLELFEQGGGIEAVVDEDGREEDSDREEDAEIEQHLEQALWQRAGLHHSFGR